MTRPRILLCDLDGTLADSLPAMRVAYDAFLQASGRIGTTAEFDALNGPTLDEIPLLLAQRHGLDGEPELLQRAYLGCVLRAYESVSPAVGLVDTLDKLVADGWSLAVVTANAETVARRWLLANDLDRFFPLVVAMTPGLRGKPEPDLYLRALSLLECTAADTVALEDSTNGVAAARAAGIRVLRFGTADADVQSMAQLVSVLRLT